MTDFDFGDFMTPIEEEPDPGYPPIGTPETALVLAIDCDNYPVLGHTGRYMHAQMVCAGVDGQEVGLNTDQLDVAGWEPGYCVLERGVFWESRDCETNVVDDCGLDGHWRRAVSEDFMFYGIAIPIRTRAEQKLLNDIIVGPGDIA